MKDELTTVMHAEFLEGEVSPTDLAVYAVFGAIRRGADKADACRDHGISVEYYDANIEQVLNDPSW